MDTALKVVAEYGPFALLCLAEGWIIYKLWQRNNALQDLRIQEAKEVVALQELRVQEAKERESTLLEISEKTNTALGGITSAVSSLKDVVMMDLKD